MSWLLAALPARPQPFVELVFKSFIGSSKLVL